MKVGKQDKELVFLGTNTTGLFPAHHEVIEVMCMSRDGEQLLHARTLPHYPERMDMSAEEASGYSRSEWEQSPEYTPDWREVVVRLQQVLSGKVVVGFTIGFHMSMLMPYFRKYDNRTPQSFYIPLDLQNLYAGKHREIPISIYKLCQSLGVEYSKEYTLEEKLDSARLVYKAIME